MTITTNITASARAVMLAASIGAATLALSACGDQVQPPAQEIKVELPEPPAKNYEPACNTQASMVTCPDQTFAPNRQKIDSGFAPGAGPNRQKIDSEFAPGR